MSEYYERMPPKERKEFGDRVQKYVNIMGEFMDNSTGEFDARVVMSGHASILASLFYEGMRIKALSTREVKKMLVALYYEAQKGPPDERH